MSSAIEILWKQAIKTFAGRQTVGYQLCSKNFDKLRNLINDIRADDVKIDKCVLHFVETQDAPLCVMDVYGDQNMTIAIFLLKHGVTMPMHDHPGMHGLLKVISGVVKITSYTAQTKKDWLIQPGEKLKALKHPALTVCETDSACVFTPESKNFHEITCVEGPAVFLDILSPPYITEPTINDTCLRPCTYFRENSSTATESNETTCEVQLIAMTRPPELYTIGMKYRGPPLR